MVAITTSNEPRTTSEYTFKYLPKPQGKSIYDWRQTLPGDRTNRGLGAFIDMVHVAAGAEIEKKPESYLKMLDIAYGSGFADRDPDRAGDGKILPAVASVLDKTPYGIPTEKLRTIYPEGTKMKQSEFDCVVISLLAQNKPELALQFITEAPNWIEVAAGRDGVDDALSRLFSIEYARRDTSPFAIASEVLPTDELGKARFFNTLKEQFKTITDPKIRKNVAPQFKYIYESVLKSGKFEEAFAEWNFQSQ